MPVTKTDLPSPVAPTSRAAEGREDKPSTASSTCGRCLSPDLVMTVPLNVSAPRSTGSPTSSFSSLR